MERAANPKPQHSAHPGAGCPCQAGLSQGLLQLMGVMRSMSPAHGQSDIETLI